ncbi:MULTISPECIES: DUF1294 domain-containing protein [Pseudomonas]|uniref:DUF1294 domain-containing protein n=1 Tax=Pseudomonas bijieensis TaxID=2681983 RepID=A0A6N1C7G7_9PSED|nr:MULTISPECIES: DUF1294 domain-containing protein [Pseudomonas]PWJ32569.1 uncharacterized membrane protein YsdA (DUF1294 family) [Pseudomonas sp. 43mfcvi1.1]QKS81174.1 DUF1294 domain-containing protein [Pseudomonas bijieensis]SSB98624.1 Uncharacterized membrane protein YsdA, DUF1294 family [Pseudomonas sp. 43mfcvi1.1]
MNDSGGRKRTGRSADGAVQHLRLKLMVFALLCALPLFGSLLFGLRAVSWVPLVAYGVVSVVAFLLYWSDKRKARTDAWRTPENVLHAVELAGGWPGALLAQQLFRHKTRKVSFQMVFWFIVMLHQVFWIDQLFLGSYLF